MDNKGNQATYKKVLEAIKIDSAHWSGEADDVIYGDYPLV